MRNLRHNRVRDLALRAWVCLPVIGVVVAEEPSIPLPHSTTHPGGTGVYDPLRGLDASGRIPKVDLSERVPNPERWRYIPEGRIHPGNVFERFLVTSFVAPVLYFEEDIGFGGGIALTDIDFRGQRRQEFFGMFAAASTEGQQSYVMVWKRALQHRELGEPNGGVAIEERSWVQAAGGYNVIRTQRFYGFGADTTPDDETSFSDATIFARSIVNVSYPDPGSNWVAGGGLRFESHELDDGLVSEAGQTSEDFPDAYSEAADHQALWAQALLRYDTRDSIHQAYSGWYVGLAADGAPLQNTGGVGVVMTASGGYVWDVPSLFHDGGSGDEENPPTDTIVFGAFVKDTIGDLPFWALPSLGGSDTLRGYIGNRFTDRAAWHAALEWRSWPVARGVSFSDSIRIERLGFAVFAEAGSVATDATDLWDATVHKDVGIGLRLGIERTAVFRIDVGVGDEGAAVTATFGMSL